MSAMPTREAAWFAVQDALPAYWLVGPVTFDPGRRRFSVTARGPHRGRGKMPIRCPGPGKDEIVALLDLHARLTGPWRLVEDPASESLLNRRLRLAF
jgi:hypothetical protein